MMQIRPLTTSTARPSNFLSPPSRALEAYKKASATVEQSSFDSVALSDASQSAEPNRSSWLKGSSLLALGVAAFGLFGATSAAAAGTASKVQNVSVSEQAGREVREAGLSIAKDGKKVGQDAAKVGKAIGKEATKVGKEIGKEATKTGKEAAKAGKAIGKEAADVGKEIGKEATKVGKGIAKEATSFGKGVAKEATGFWKGLTGK